MNVHSSPHLTPVETSLVAAFTERAASLPGNADVTMRRDTAVEQLKAGLPTRRVETWHYTDLRRLLSAVPDFDPAVRVRPVSPLIEGSPVLPVLNGVSVEKLPAIEGVGIKRMSDLLADGTFAPGLALQGADDTIGALNAAFVADGYFLDIAAGVALEKPIEVQNIQGAGQTHVRLPVQVGAGARATIVERQAGEAAGLSTSVSNLVVGDGAEVLWIIVQEEAEDATHLGQFNAWIGKDARLTLFFMNAGGKLVRQEVRVAVRGEGSDFQLRGINLLSGETHTDVTMVLDHEAPGTGSRELVRNVVTGRAHGVFQGRINVHQKAQKTDAKMACNTLLLSDDGEFSTKPELEIFADDVQCGHGATVTEIDHEHLFYLKARGIDEKSARGLLVKAFLAEVVEELEDEAIVAALEEKLDAWFAAHG